MGGLYSHTYRATGTVLTQGIYNGDHQSHIDNQTPQMTDDYSSSAAQMQSTADPYPGSVESLASSLAGELERLRYVLKQITGKDQWYIDPDHSLNDGIVNVKDNGASPSATGAANTTAFNASLTTGNIIVPSGTYTIGSSITVPSNRLVYLMPGAILKAANVAWTDTAILDITDATNVTILGGGTLDGDKANNATGRIFGIKVHDSTTVRILGLTIQNMPGQDATGINGGDAIIVMGDAAGVGSADVLIQGNRLLNNVRQGISLVIGSDIRILGNSIKGTSGSDPGAGIDIEPNQATETVRDVVITGNSFDDNNYHVYVANSGTDVHKNILIANNTLRYSRHTSGAGGGIVVRRTGVQVVENTIRTNKGAGIVVLGASQIGILCNTIIGEDSTSERGGIRIYDSSAVQVHDNTLSATRFDAIMVDSTVALGIASAGSSDISIKQNLLLDCVTAGGTSYPLTLQSNGTAGRLLERIEIIGNTVRDTRSGGNEADFGIAGSGATAAEKATWKVFDNQITGPASTYNSTILTRYAGAATNISDGGTINHSLGTTPTQVRATGSVAGEIVTVTAVAATTFTVAIKTHAGAAGTAQTIYWEAWVS